MYTRQQISLIESIPQSELFEREMNELIDILNQLKDSTKYPILSQAIILSPLLTNTYLSYQKLKSGLNLKEIAQLQNVKLNTIEDHILEMYIKGYLIDYTLFINKKDILEFINYYQKHRGERLKFYKEHFTDWTYFQIKLVIVGIERGDLIAEDNLKEWFGFDEFKEGKKKLLIVSFMEGIHLEFYQLVAVKAYVINSLHIY